MPKIAQLLIILLMLVSAFDRVRADAVSPECQRIRQQISEAESIIHYAKHNMAPVEAANVTISSNNKLRHYEQEYSDLGCDGSSPNKKDGDGETTSGTEDQCFSQCKKYTKRTNEQCFDSCWKK